MKTNSLKERLVGLETELLLVDDQGYVSNKALEIVNNSKNSGKIVPEFCTAVIEINPNPSSKIKEIENNLLNELKSAQYIAESLGITPVPLSEIGPGDCAKRIYNNIRYNLYEETVGKKQSNIERSCCATHLHVDQNDNIVGEYNLLQSMDPVFVLMSSSSYIRGSNSVNCGRVNLFRNSLFPGNPYMNKLLNYISSKEDLENLQYMRSDFFLSKIAPTKQNQQIFGSYNNGSTPIRKTNHTIEIRCADANIPSLALAMAALYKGILEYVFEIKKLEIKISKLDSLYHITSSEIYLPSYTMLKKMEYEGLIKGPASQLVNDYLSYLADIAEQGLTNEEAAYLTPFKNILRYKRNVANIINKKARIINSDTNGSISIASAAQIHLFIAEQYKDNINGGSQLMDMIRFGI